MTKENTKKSTFAKGNFSTDLRHFDMSKADFKKAYAGKLNVDIETLYDDIKKAKTVYEKANKKSTPKKAKAEPVEANEEAAE